MDVLRLRREGGWLSRRHAAIATDFGNPGIPANREVRITDLTEPFDKLDAA
jgi:hypothetical protein